MSSHWFGYRIGMRPLTKTMMVLMYICGAYRHILYSIITFTNSDTRSRPRWVKWPKPFSYLHFKYFIKAGISFSTFSSTGHKWTGPWFNIKMSSHQYRKSHCGDKTVERSSYLHNGIFYTDKMTSLYWISPLVIRAPAAIEDYAPQRGAMALDGRTMQKCFLQIF